MSKLKIGKQLHAAMLTHAAAQQPRECCGLIVRNERTGRLAYLPGTNVAQGNDQFRMDSLDWIDAEIHGEVVAVVHSHPNASANPSMADRVQCAKSELPWVIVGWPSGAVVQVQPGNYQAPLEGRDFAHGVLDCYTLVQDWYHREWGLQLPDFEREDRWWERGGNLYRDGLAAAGFEVVQASEPLRGDGLLMRIASDVENHAAVYLGDGMMLHHLYGHLSRREVWDWPWQRRTACIVRHRSRLAAEARSAA